MFEYENEYWDEDLGVFTLWVWSGYCLNKSMPNEFPAFYHKTKSNKKCEWYIKEDEYEILAKKFQNQELTYEKFKFELDIIRKEKEEAIEASG